MEKIINSIEGFVKKSNLDFSRDEITKAVEKIGESKANTKDLTAYIRYINVLRELTFERLLEENNISNYAGRFNFWGLNAGSSMIYEAKQNGIPAINNVVVTDSEIIIYGYDLEFNVMEKHRHSLSDIVKISNYRIGIIQTTRDTILTVEFSGGEKVILTIGKDYREEQNLEFLKLMNTLTPDVIDRKLLNIWNVVFGFGELNL